jgi:hypothetical protein
VTILQANAQAMAFEDRAAKAKKAAHDGAAFPQTMKAPQ